MSRPFVHQRHAVVLLAGLWIGASLAVAAEPPGPSQAFLREHCFACHAGATRSGGLDLTTLRFDPDDPTSFAAWVKIHDRIRDGEMPPKDAGRPKPAAVRRFLQSTAGPLAAADRARARREGRAVLRRLNRYEYENTLRDLLNAPWLHVKEMLPEDGEAHRFNKSGEALDVSHVQVAGYLGAAELALRQVLETGQARPETRRFYAREQPVLVRKMTYRPGVNTRAERATFPMLGTRAQPEVLEGKAPVTVGASNPVIREQEAFGTVGGTYTGNELRFDRFKCEAPGRYRLRVSAYSFWAGPGEGEKWWIPDRTKTYPGRRNEPVTLYARKPGVQRRLGSFDVSPEPAVHELEVHLLPGDVIWPDAARLFRSRPPNWRNPLATREGMPGVAYRWIEVEGPLPTEKGPDGARILAGDLPLRKAAGGSVEIVSANPTADLERLLQAFLLRAYRRPAREEELQRFVGVSRQALAGGSNFTEALLAGYTAILCSPGFLWVQEQPGRLDSYALSERLAYFLWNSPPDAELRKLAENGLLSQPRVLQAQTTRLLADTRSRRFMDAFLDYWLDLRKIDTTAPDAALYPDYYLDDLLKESAVEETQLFFSELLRRNLPARYLAASDFAMLNERLATHYGLPPVEGGALRRVPLPPDSPRGGLLTQASILKVTANGTTTSPVLRGAWVMERIIGKPPPPPPPSVPAIEPDIRGATTIREQLDKHRSVPECAGCHARIDPAGFALENFDVFGGWRRNYRAVGDGEPVPGFGKNGQPFTFHYAQPVEANGVLPGGEAFRDVRELKRLLVADERQLARNLVRQLATYGTGAPVRFGDRAEIERILDRAKADGYGVRSLIHGIVQSEVFRWK